MRFCIDAHRRAPFSIAQNLRRWAWQKGARAVRQALKHAVHGAAVEAATPLKLNGATE